MKNNCIFPTFSFKETLALVLGLLFLVTYWLFGYDGITFSDEVTYLQLGHQLWDNQNVLSGYHFTSRWGAFLFSGFFTHLLGFNDRYASLATLMFYMAALCIVWKVSPTHFRKWAVIFFIGHVYLLHFLPKVYPDGFLILWVVLIPASAIFRKKYPALAALVMVMAFFVGFCTKETIVLLFPFPLLLFLVDHKEKQVSAFYGYFGLLSLLLILFYLGYYQWQFGDWLYRFKSVNEGHYISEYTYYDKGWWSILKRLSYLPFITFFERTYWPWLVMAIPGIYVGIKKRESVKLEFAIGSLCLIIGFWFMTSTLEFYNPIYLNPRHLIVWVAPLAVNIAWGADLWLNNQRWKKALASLLVLGGCFSLLLGDWKISLFYLLFAGMLYIKQEKTKFRAMALCLILPVVFAVYYQYQLKNYPHFLRTFQAQVNQASKASPLLTHEFIVFSREILLRQPQVKAPVVSLYNLDSLQQDPPQSFTLLVYKYYRHAYPAEQEYLDQAQKWIQANYQLVGSTEDQWLSIHRYEEKREMKDVRQNVEPNRIPK